MKYLFIALILSLFLVGCQPISWTQNEKGLLEWNYGDLRLLDAIDAIEPDQDLIALYTRINNQSFQIRLDFLDLTTLRGKDIYIPLDTNPGGTTPIGTNNNGILASDINWDYLIKISDSGNVEVLNTKLSLVPRVDLFLVFDALQDMLVISFNKSALPIFYGQTKLQVIITPPNQNVVSDKSEPFSIDTPNPSRAKVLFAFWNTFSSITPAQTLRSWAGAHSGPMSSRHGISFLLDSAKKTNSTIFLLDLLTPENISSLDYINALTYIRNLVVQGLLVLPDVSNIYDIASARYLLNPGLSLVAPSNLDFYNIWNIESNINLDNGSNRSNFILLLNKYILLNNRLLINSVNGYTKYIYNNCELLPRTSSSSLVNRLTYFPVDCKALLLFYAMTQPTAPLILGGDFSQSMLGDPAFSDEVFTYIKSHPWIQVPSISDFKSSYESSIQGLLSDHEINPTVNSNLLYIQLPSNPDISSMVYDSLLQLPENQLTDLARKVFFSLTQSTSQKLLTLQSNYIGQIGFILAGAKWAENPSPRISCSSDLDYDGASECILANDNFIAIIEPNGGYIPFVFARDAQGIHQIIGPTWEFEVGLSDPSSWNTDLGERGDSSQVLGAFQDQFDQWNIYNFKINKNELELQNNISSIKKTITIFSNSLHIGIQNTNQSQVGSSIPLVIDPWFRYTSGWGDNYMFKIEPFVTMWGIKSGEMVEIRSLTQLNLFSFNSTRRALSFPEDPNYDYLKGHYLPYPMSVAEIHGTNNYTVDIIINP